MYGKTNMESTQIDQIIDTFQDLLLPLSAAVSEKDKAKKVF